jgi:hypothetical protein
VDNLPELLATGAIRVGAVAAIAVMGPLCIAAFLFGAMRKAGASLPYIVIATLVGSTLWSLSMLIFWARRIYLSIRKACALALVSVLRSA